MITPELISSYNRPVRSFVWVLLIILHCTIPPIINIPEAILYAMFADLGLNSVTRTIEKVRANRKETV